MSDNPIDFSCSRVGTGGPHVGENFARGIVDDYRRTVAHVARQQFRDVLAQDVPGEALQVRIQRGLHALTRGAQQRTRDLRRQSVVDRSRAACE